MLETTRQNIEKISIDLNLQIGEFVSKHKFFGRIKTFTSPENFECKYEKFQRFYLLVPKEDHPGLHLIQDHPKAKELDE